MYNKPVLAKPNPYTAYYELDKEVSMFGKSTDLGRVIEFVWKEGNGSMGIVADTLDKVIYHLNTFRELYPTAEAAHFMFEVIGQGTISYAAILVDFNDNSSRQSLYSLRRGETKMFEHTSFQDLREQLKWIEETYSDDGITFLGSVAYNKQVEPTLPSYNNGVNLTGEEIVFLVDAVLGILWRGASEVNATMSGAEIVSAVDGFLQGQGWRGGISDEQVNEIAENSLKRTYPIEDQQKLAYIERNANNYVHPGSHHATFITQDEEHRFVSDVEKARYEGKADVSYIDALIESIIGGAPEALNALNELATAMGNDPNFATNVATEIGKKVNTSDFVAHRDNTDVHITLSLKNKLINIQEGATAAQAQAIALNTAKVGITTTQAQAISENTTKRTYPLTDQQKLANIEAGATVGATTSQAAAIAVNTAKVGITVGQANAITDNTAKRTYPQEDENKLATLSTTTLRTETETFTLTAADANVKVRYTGASDITVTVPNTLPANAFVMIRQSGAGVVTLAPANAEVLNGAMKTNGQHSSILIEKISNNLFDITGGVE